MYGEKDADGFYWGECRGRRGYVPYNMVEELKDPPGQGQPGRRGPAQSERWGDIYASMPVKKMIALYDYDPHELSPNVDAVRFLSRNTSILKTSSVKILFRYTFFSFLRIRQLSSTHKLHI